jgi:hypothetical protein
MLFVTSISDSFGLVSVSLRPSVCFETWLRRFPVVEITVSVPGLAAENTTERLSNLVRKYDVNVALHDERDDDGNFIVTVFADDDAAVQKAINDLRNENL